MLRPIIVSSLLLACFLGVAIACTHEDCRGPVVMTYASSDCSGSPSSITELVSNASWVNNPYACIPTGSGDNTVTYRCEEGFYTETYHPDSACFYMDYHSITKTSLCVNDAGVYKVYLCNVNNTFTAGSAPAPNSSLTTLSNPAEETCDKPFNCTGFITYNTEYNGDVCDPRNATVSKGRRETSSYGYNKCFLSPDHLSNVQLTCGRLTIDANYYQNGDSCTGQPWRTLMQNKSCRPSDGVMIDTECDDGAPGEQPTSSPHDTPSTEVPATPNASFRASASVALVVLAIFAALLMYT